MSRIPNEGLKRNQGATKQRNQKGLNEQNPERGIETAVITIPEGCDSGLNEQNPERGIETGKRARRANGLNPGLNEQNPERGIETRKEGLRHKEPQPV